MVKGELLRQWEKDEVAHFEGWDFSYLKERMSTEHPPWNYVELAKKLVKSSTSLLDMATGGGEVFSQLKPFPKETYAIEGWHPNVAVAEKRLAPLGVKVIEAESSHKLPFKKGQFDLVVNRHGGYDVGELSRIIKSGGTFFSQQVSGDNLLDLQTVFGTKPKWEFNTLQHRIPEFESHGFVIEKSDDWTGKAKFLDVGAIVYFLKAIPWVVDNFSVETHLPFLEKLQEILDAEGELKFTYTRHLIQANRVKSPTPKTLFEKLLFKGIDLVGEACMLYVQICTRLYLRICTDEQRKKFASDAYKP